MGYSPALCGVSQDTNPLLFSHIFQLLAALKGLVRKRTALPFGTACPAPSVMGQDGPQSRASSDVKTL
jgi:hypothetical protein